jgi:hypothetical protein
MLYAGVVVTIFKGLVEGRTLKLHGRWFRQRWYRCCGFGTGSGAGAGAGDEGGAVGSARRDATVYTGTGSVTPPANPATPIPNFGRGPSAPSLHLHCVHERGGPGIWYEEQELRQSGINSLYA